MHHRRIQVVSNKIDSSVRDGFSGDGRSFVDLARCFLPIFAVFRHLLTELYRGGDRPLGGAPELAHHDGVEFVAEPKLSAGTPPTSSRSTCTQLHKHPPRFATPGTALRWPSAHSTPRE
jgi:hypothetical protein